MLTRLIKNDINKHRLLSYATVIFMALSSLLIVLSLTLFTNLIGSVNNLMEKAKTPDYLQMHAGQINDDALNAFAHDHQEIEDWQVSRFLNIDNSRLYLNGENIADNTQDNGVCLQGSGFDYLLDMDNRQPDVRPGQIYVPVCYRQLYQLKEGEIIRIVNQEYLIAGFIRDSQMNAMMASSKRFLVSEEDYDKLYPLGHEEYLIEYRLKPGTDLDAFAAAYRQAGLPDNGPTITKALIRLMNALSDGIMILIIFLVGIVILVISLLCIGYITSIGVERDRREAGLLKALGIPKKQIRKMYQAKYLLFAIVGGGTGFILALILAVPLGRSLKALYGTPDNTAVSLSAGLLIGILIQAIILLFIRRILKKNEKISVIDALFRDRSFGRRSTASQMVLIGLVTALCSLMALIPQNLYTTLAAPGFVSYMGIGSAEYRLDVRQSDDIASVTKHIVDTMEQDASIDNYVALKTVSCPALVDQESPINLLIEVGDHSVFPVAYTEGRSPQKKGDIALSVLQAKDLGLGLGDTMTIGTEESFENVVVCGIYSDITNGGKTAKMSRLTDNNSDTPVIWSIIYVSLTAGSDKEAWLSRYSGLGADVVNIADYVKATYGPTIEQVDQVKVAALNIALFIIIVVVILFVSLMIEKNRISISLRKALGFRNKVIRKQYMRKGLRPVLIGIATGAVLSIVFGQAICEVALQALGACGFQFVISISGVLMVFSAFIMSGFIAVFVGTAGTHRISASECCRGKE
ncbi:MAG: ABC transporter permease [Lachnospiraceae bacterium]|nr:ABC transporter permease [Lachnospiraceae bacterium]